VALNEPIDGELGGRSGGLARIVFLGVASIAVFVWIAIHLPLVAVAGTAGGVGLGFVCAPRPFLRTLLRVGLAVNAVVGLGALGNHTLFGAWHYVTFLVLGVALTVCAVKNR
jgi:hypothetical protein